MTLFVTSIYAALLAILFVVLSFRVIFVRQGQRVSLGDGDDPVLQARIRVHANFAEYTPLALLLMLMLELQGGSAILLHALGLTLLVGRIGHAWGVSQHPQIMRFRQAGMILTFTALLIGAIANLWLALF